MAISMEPNTSRIECCFKHTVAIQMDTIRIPEAHTRGLFFERVWLRQMEIWTPMELYAWMLGNTLIHGSMLHSFATRKQKIFLSGSMAGRKSVPLGYRVHTRRLMVMPVNKKVHSR